MTSTQNIDRSALPHPFPPAQESDDSNAIDICAAVQKALTCLKVAATESTQKIAKYTKLTLISGTLVLTNSVLSVTVGLTKLTGFTLVSTFAIKCLTGRLHQANCALAKQGPTLLNNWATLLNEEHKRITETEKVIWLKNGKPYCSLKNYKIRLCDSFKAIMAPISLTLTAVNAVFWVATKPLYASLLLPGALADHLLLAPLALNVQLSKWTYSPLLGLTSKMFVFQWSHCTEVRDFLDGVCNCSGNDD